MSRKRKRPVRSKSIRVARASKAEQERARLSLATLPRQLPETRGDCMMGPRPCVLVSCKHNLYLDVNPDTGTIKLNHPRMQPHQMKHSCALDVAQAGGVRLEDLGELLNVTRERARQIEVQAVAKLKDAGGLEAFRELVASERFTQEAP